MAICRYRLISSARTLLKTGSVIKRFMVVAMVPLPLPPPVCILIKPCSDQLDAAGIPKTEVTLHVGAGTFQPVRAVNIADHTMHSEYIEVDQACSVTPSLPVVNEGPGRPPSAPQPFARWRVRYSLRSSADGSATIATYSGDT